MPPIRINSKSGRSKLYEALVVLVQQPDVDPKCCGFYQLIDHGISLKAVDKVSEVITNEFFCPPVQDKLRLIIKDEYGFSYNKDFKSATTGFYTKGDVVLFQKIKWIKCSKDGRDENIAPGRIRRFRRRRNKRDKDDEDDGEDNRRPSDSHVLSYILKIVIILMLLLIMLSLILWLMY